MSDLPPEPALEDVIGRLGVSGESIERQRQAAMEAAYGGRLTVVELRLLRQADLIPHKARAPATETNRDR